MLSLKWHSLEMADLDLSQVSNSLVVLSFYDSVILFQILCQKGE